MKIIVFTGAMGVGKSTAIEYLRQIAGQTTFNIKFAQPLYDMQELIYGRIGSVYPRPANFTKDRKLLQWLGTEWGRGCLSESLWVDLWRVEVKQTLGYYPNAKITCDDVRFDNEAETVKSLGGAIIKLTSNKSEARIDTKSGISSHASEAGVNPKYLDFTVTNDGSLEDFKSSLLPVFKAILNSSSND